MTEKYCYFGGVTDLEKYNELSYYTLTHPGEHFIHQHLVDVNAAQHADQHTKPIIVFFALAGLYLFVEKNYTSLQVRDAHMQMAKKTKQFPTFRLPEDRGDITVADILAIPPGTVRDEMIRLWCISVWNCFADERLNIIAFTEKLLT